MLNQDTEIVKLLLDHGATVNSLGMARAYTILFGAVLFEKAEIVRVLLEGGAEVDAQGVLGVFRQDTPIHIASSLGNIEIVKLLLDWGADLNAKTKEEKTALQIAKSKGHEAVAELLQAREMENE